MDRDQITATLELYGLSPAYFMTRHPNYLRLRRPGDSERRQLVWRINRWTYNKSGNAGEYLPADLSVLTHDMWTNLGENLDNLLQCLDADS